MNRRDADSKKFDAQIGMLVWKARASSGLSVCHVLSMVFDLYGVSMDARSYRRAEIGERPFYPAELLAVCSVLRVPLSGLPLPSAAS